MLQSWTEPFNFKPFSKRLKQFTNSYHQFVGGGETSILQNNDVSVLRCDYKLTINNKSA